MRSRAERVERERRLFEEQVRESGKPAHLLDRIVTGKIEAFYKDVALLHQAWVRDDKQTIGELITAFRPRSASGSSFVGSRGSRSARSRATRCQILRPMRRRDRFMTRAPSGRPVPASGRRTTGAPRQPAGRQDAPGGPSVKPLAYQRVLVKLSGEALAGARSFGFDFEVIERFADEIKDAVDVGAEIGLVIGGGNIVRGSQLQTMGDGPRYR